jgi:hypothetical protein
VFFLPNSRGNFLPDLVDLYYIVLVSVLADWRSGPVFRKAEGHDYFLRGTKEHGGGVSNLLVHVKSNVDRVDIGFGRKGGL